jgi:hypothetical protein
MSAHAQPAAMATRTQCRAKGPVFRPTSHRAAAIALLPRHALAVEVKAGPWSREGVSREPNVLPLTLTGSTLTLTGRRTP